jgi:hypothetical protein
MSESAPQAHLALDTTYVVIESYNPVLNLDLPLRLGAMFVGVILAATYAAFSFFLSFFAHEYFLLMESAHRLFGGKQALCLGVAWIS